MYRSLYFGNSTANMDSSRKTPPLLSSGLNSSIFHFTPHQPWDENTLDRLETNMINIISVPWLLLSMPFVFVHRHWCPISIMLQSRGIGRCLCLSRVSHTKTQPLWCRSVSNDCESERKTSASGPARQNSHFGQIPIRPSCRASIDIFRPHTILQFTTRSIRRLGRSMR